MSTAAKSTVPIPAKPSARDAGRAEAALATVGVRQLIDFDEPQRFVALDDELGDALAAANLEGLGRVGVDEQHLQLAPIATVD